MKTSLEIGTIVDPIAKQSQNMYGGDTPPEIYARNLDRLAMNLRCYGKNSGIALLLGRLCVMMEYSPRQAAQFAQEVAKCREEACLGFLAEAAKQE